MKMKIRCSCGYCQQPFYGRFEGKDMCKAHYMHAVQKSNERPTEPPPPDDERGTSFQGWTARSLINFMLGRA